MARKAREKTSYGTYLIKNQSGASRPLFVDNRDREDFLTIVQAVLKKFDVRIYGYDLSKDTAYLLILYDNGSDLSKVMKSITIRYAMKVNCKGKLFKDRYKSELLHTQEELKMYLDSLRAKKDPYIACSPKEDHFLLSGEIFFGPPGQTLEKACFYPPPHCEGDGGCIESLAKAMDYLKERATLLDVSLEQLMKDKSLRNTEICALRRNSTLSLKELGELFGGLSESTICKIINQNKVVS